jgi:quaternary ammonium compound-resistance protein SugE
MAWLYLVIAGIFETVWAAALKQSAGFTRLWPSVITVVAMAASIYLLAQAMKELPLGTAYAVWTGIGAVGAAVLGMVLLGESAAPLRIISILLIILGIAGLRLTAS